MTKRQLKGKTLNERAKMLGIATDLPALNRSQRRKDLKQAIKEELKGAKKVNGEEYVRHG